jgi:hypothetical protein
MTRLNIDSDAVGVAASGDDDLAVGAVGLDRVNPAPAQFEQE